jgi:hypothetical protein
LLGLFPAALGNLAAAVPVPLDADRNPVLPSINVETLRSVILGLASFGLPDAVPLSATSDSDATRQGLAEQGLRLLKAGMEKLARPTAAQTAAADASRPADLRFLGYRLAAQEIFGPSFNPVPRFALGTPAEIQAAAAFRDLPPDQGLTRFHQETPLLVDEWLQGAVRTHSSLANLGQILILSELFAVPGEALKPLQLPFRAGHHWVAVEFPAFPPDQIGEKGVFYLQGEFVSLIQCLPANGFDPSAPQSGLLVDEWSEVIPGQVDRDHRERRALQPAQHRAPAGATCWPSHPKLPGSGPGRSWKAS